MPQSNLKPDNGVMLNAYPDSLGDTLNDMICFLRRPELMDVFSSFYILPSLFNTDLDHGFSVIDYGLNELYAAQEDITALRNMGITLKLDFVLNHLSVLSEQFQDILRNGENSKYRDFFIDWNRFWEDNGDITKQGYIQPHERLIRNMFFRKPGLPLLMVRFPDGTDIPYWNTFYQEIRYERVDAQDLMHAARMQYASAVKLADIINAALESGKKPGEISFGPYEKYALPTIAYLESRRKYLGQMDLNIKSPEVWRFYADTFNKLAGYGASIVRLDAFAYTSKEVGKKNFFNEPETIDLLRKIKTLADKHNVMLLPEIHTGYDEKAHEKIAMEGYMVYDFFLPGLVIDALERRSGNRLVAWAKELREKKICSVNMLGCHDGIALLDLQGLIPREEIETLIQIIIDRGGIVKNLHGQKKMYYQVNATYYSAIGGDDRKMLLARAIQLFMPGIPQVWYLDLFLGKNDHEAVRRVGESGHREINRTRLTVKDAIQGLQNDTVRRQLDMLRFRNTFPAFGFSTELTAETPSENELILRWRQHGYLASLTADLRDYSFAINGIAPDGTVCFR